MALEKIVHNAHDRVHPNVAEHLRNYPLERLWYLLFDYNRRDLGPAGFDKPPPVPGKERDEHEKGYMSSMFSGFNYVLATIDEPLSLDYIKGLHDAAVSKVMEEIVSLSSDNKNKTTVMKRKHERGYRQGDSTIRVGLIAEGDRRNVTMAGLKELRDRIRNGDDYFRIVFEDDDYVGVSPRSLDKADISDEELYTRIRDLKNVYTIRFPCDPIEILNRLKNIINTLNAYIASPEISEDEKIRAIAKCVQDILLTHPFYDGNGRTTSLLLNKLLLQYNLSPTILDNPTIIDAFSVDELCEEIKKGQAVFRAQKNNPYCADLNVPETEDSVMYLQENPNVAALLVHSAATRLTRWDSTNIGDRNLAVDLLVEDLVTSSPTLSATQVNQKNKDITEKIVDATYKRGSFEFFSNGSMFSEVMRSASHGKIGEATHMIFGGNQYGIDCTKLKNSDQQQHTPSQSSSTHRF